MTKTQPPPPADYPPDVIAADTQWPRENGPYSWYRDNNVPHELVFYKVQGTRIKDSWVIVTLPIDNKGRAYVIQVESGNTGRAGRGPHVKAEVRVYLSPANLPRLQKYVDLWRKGMAEAGAVRDRISSRRAQGQIERMKGRTTWRWDS